MLLLAVANLTHRKVRSGLSVLAVAIAVSLLLILVGLSKGTLNEVAQRMQSVDAEILVCADRDFDPATIAGGKLWEKEIPAMLKQQIDGVPAVRRVMPVFLGRIKLAGLMQNVFGVHPDDFRCFRGSRKILEGQCFSDTGSLREAFELFANDAIQNPSGSGAQLQFLALVIDERLARAGGFHVGDVSSYGNTPARIVGIVETGVAGRVFAPINMLRAANGIAASTAHMFFVKAGDGLDTAQLRRLAEQIEAKSNRSATLVANYGQILSANFRNLTIFVNLVSVIALIICFLFVLVTMYTMVLERGREIAILQSLGADRWAILRQTLQEALLLCTLGTILGVAMTYGGRWCIETAQPLMTVEVRGLWLAAAAGVGIGGGCLSALYPGYLAVRHDPVEALSFE